MTGQARGHRLRFDGLPAAVRGGLERQVGSAVVEASHPPGGYSPSLAAACTLADGRTVFVKAVSSDQNPDAPEFLRREAAVAARLPIGAPAPRLLHVIDDGHWIVLVYEHVPGRLPRIPWDRSELAEVLDAAGGLAELEPPDGLPTIVERYGPVLNGWRQLAADPATVLDRGVPDDDRRPGGDGAGPGRDRLLPRPGSASGPAWAPDGQGVPARPGRGLSPVAEGPGRVVLNCVASGGHRLSSTGRPQSWPIVSEPVADHEHPAIAGRGTELAALAASVRRLAALTVTTAAEPALLRRVGRDLDRAAAELEAALPDEPIPRFGATTGTEAATDIGSLIGPATMPFDMVMGRYNPIAPPVRIESDLAADPPLAIGRVEFGTVHEGAPGCVHGAVLAGVFDIVLTVANRLAGAAGPTTRLAYRFRRPTLLGVECRFECWVVSVDDRRVTSHGRLVQDGHVTVEAEGRFAVFTPEQVRSLGASRARTESSPA